MFPLYRGGRRTGKPWLRDAGTAAWSGTCVLGGITGILVGMQQSIHPTYHSDAKVRCSGCGREFTVGSTAEEIRVELCSQCHPFYTGKQKLVDTAGRVERYRERASRAKAEAARRSTKPEAKDGAQSTAEAGPSSAERLEAMRQELEERSD